MSVLELQQKAFKIFNDMQPNQVIIVKEFATRDPAAFIQYGKDYIDQGGCLEFNGDYSKIFKISEIPRVK